MQRSYARACVKWYTYKLYSPPPPADHVTCFVSQFMQDAQDVMDMLVKVQNDQGDMEPDDPQVKQGREKNHLGGQETSHRTREIEAYMYT